MNASIFILMDALGWEWIKDHPFLKEVAPYRRALDSVLGFSTAAIPSILTGKFPQEHGRLSLFHMAQDRSPFNRLSWICSMPPAVVENRYVRYGVKRIARRLNNLNGYFQLYGVPLSYLPKLDVCEKRNIYAPGGIPGSTSIFDMLERNSTPYRVYCYHDGPDRQLLEAIETDLRRGEAKFYFLYLAELDAFLHHHADDERAVSAVLAHYSDAIAHLYEVARATYAQADIHVFGDHGMAPTRQTANLQERLARLPISAPDDYLCILDSTMARFWFFSDSARGMVMAALGEEKRGSWLSRAELEGLRAWFPDRRYGEEIFLMEQGTVIAPSHMGITAPAGMHGFHPAAQWSRSAFVSSADYGNELSQITDIFGIMQAHA
ncbi:MAG TPA: alkaline phosphatase family protein [Candidatus Binataceae bacterium]|nr:alkaline phosphatase family protein [Candidatus Binataceae bacterium]